MEAQLLAGFQNLNLGNLSEKLTSMRDKLRNDINHDMQYMQLKLNKGESSQGSKRTSKLNSNSNMDSRRISDATGQLANPDNIDEVNIEEGEPQMQVQSSNSILNLQFAEEPVDVQEIKRLASKKISEAYWDQYIKCTLKQQIVDKVKQLFQQIEDANQKVTTKQLILKINRMGVKFNQSTAVQIPLLKRKLNLKKVLFQLYLKTKTLPDKITWVQFKQAIQDYRFPTKPTIDQYMANEVPTHPKSKNYFNISPQLIDQLKTIYNKCSKESFLFYCPIAALLTKIQKSTKIQANMLTAVRPKSNYEVQVTLKDTIKYIGNHAPQFVDIDQFLLFFTVKGFTYYPIQQRFVPNNNTQNVEKLVNKPKPANKISTKPRKKAYFDQYQLSSPKIDSIRHKKLEQMLQEKQIKNQLELKKHFKAKPVPKSISKQKYQQFIGNLNHKLEQGRKNLETERIKSEHEIERLKKATKLFTSPKKHENNETKKHQIAVRQLPQFVKQPKLGQIQVQKATRRNKIYSETQLKYQRSWQELPAAAIREHSPKCRQHQIKENYQISIRQIPDYRAEQQKMEYQLQQKKNSFKPTKPTPFYFHSNARHPQCQKNFEARSSQPFYKNYDYKEIIYSPEPQIYYTQKFADSVVANKKKALIREEQINQKLNQQAQREKRHQNFAKFMKASLKKLPNTAKLCENQAKNKIERHKKYWKNLDREHQNKLNQLYAKILQRPFLYEMQTQGQRKKQQQKNINQPIDTKKAKKTKKKNENPHNLSF